MNKPITIVYEELKRDIAELINASNLPPFVLESLIKDFFIEISDVAKKQYEYDKEQYESELNVFNSQEGAIDLAPEDCIGIEDEQ